jgi:glycerol-3-phosphate acyltransferase PlsY
MPTASSSRSIHGGYRYGASARLRHTDERDQPTTMIDILIAGVLGYLLGSIPTGVLVSRALRGTDVRQHGSSHTGGLNVSRVTGLGGGLITAVVDMLLGLGAVAGARLLTEDPWAATAGGVMAVIGHDWSIFIQFGGGIGLSTLVGGLLYLSPALTVAALVGMVLVWLALVGLLRIHRARATILVMLLVGPLLWALRFPPPGILLGVLGGVAVVVKTLPDWHREYE